MISEWASHVDHELSQLIKLHYHMCRPWYPLYPETVRRACRVAYASHFRALVEFFHNGRPLQSRMEGAGCEPRAPGQDITFRDLAPGAYSLPDWTDAELLRLCDADKLVGHLSKLRGARTTLENWGSDSDLAIWKENAKRLLRSVDPTLLPKTSESASRFNL